MKVLKNKQKKIEYERIVKIVKDAEKEANKFIQKNIETQLRPQTRYL